MDEIKWASISSFPFYLVSNTGLVKSLERKVKMPMGGFRTCFEKILKPRIGPHGYYYVNLCSDNKRSSECIHRLVAMAFISNPLDKRCVNHKDGNKLNNNYNNLEWATHSENNQHAYDIGIKEGSMKGKSGIKSPFSKPVSQYTKDGVFIKRFAGQWEASKEIGISQGNISAACHGLQKSAGGFLWKID